MKNSHGKPLSLEQELKLLETGFEWVTAEEFYTLIVPDESLHRSVAAVDIVNGRKELFLVRATIQGYREPFATSGCRLRTGNPEHGR